MGFPLSSARLFSPYPVVRKMKPLFSAAASLLLLAPSLAPAQAPVRDLAPGAHIRFTAPALQPEPIVGVLVRLDTDSIVLFRSPDADRLALPTSTIRHVAVNQGGQCLRTARRGAAWGIYVGGVTGIMVGLLAGRSYPSLSLPQLAGIGAAMGAGGGSLLGATIGAVRCPDQWQLYRLERDPVP